MWCLTIITYLAFFVQILFLTVAIAAGLYYLAELVEEYTVITKKIIWWMNLVTVIIYIVLWLFEGFPTFIAICGILAQLLHFLILIDFPYVVFLSPSFLIAVLFIILNHYLAFQYFATVFYSFSERIMNGTISTITCPRGKRECRLNKLHLCGLELAEDQDERVQYVMCFSNQSKTNSYKNITSECSPLIDKHEDDVWNCATGSFGHHLLNKAANKTELRGIVNIPTITFNYYHDMNFERMAIVKFFTTICRLMSHKPKQCQEGLNKDDRLRISVYYEALCPDSERFITKQLQPTYTKIGDFLMIDLVPYGKATQHKRNNKWTFKCQHGPEECLANKQQGCAIDAYPNNQTEIVTFVTCVMSSFDPGDEEIVEKCASNVGFSISSILDCSKSEKGDDILAKFGERTLKDIQPSSFIPTIIFNGVFDSKIQYGSLSNLLFTACKALSFKPKGCENARDNYSEYFIF